MKTNNTTIKNVNNAYDGSCYQLDFKPGLNILLKLFRLALV